MLRFGLNFDLHTFQKILKHRKKCPNIFFYNFFFFKRREKNWPLFGREGVMFLRTKALPFQKVANSFHVLKYAQCSETYAKNSYFLYIFSYNKIVSLRIPRIKKLISPTDEAGCRLLPPSPHAQAPARGAASDAPSLPLILAGAVSVTVLLCTAATLLMCCVKKRSGCFFLEIVSFDFL